MAARIRRELHISVEMIRGSYGEYKVLVDDHVVVDGGPLVMIGVMPSGANIVAKVRKQLAHGEAGT